jgi:hypothetical protein
LSRAGHAERIDDDHWKVPKDSMVRYGVFVDRSLITNPTAAIAIAPTTAPVRASMITAAASTALSSFRLPLPVTTVSTIV